MRDNKLVRLLTYVTGLVNQELLLPNEYLAGSQRYRDTGSSLRSQFRALLTSGWAEFFGSPDDSEGHPIVNGRC